MKVWAAMIVSQPFSKNAERMGRGALLNRLRTEIL